MIHIAPVEIDDDVLLSSTIAENDYDAWDSGTDYSVGDKVIRTTTHRVYENLIAGVDSTYPENATGGATPRWLDYSPTNRWAGLDDTVTTQTESSGTEEEYSFEFGIINAIGLINIEADEIDIVMEVNSSEVYNVTHRLSGYTITSWFDYWFAERVANLTDLIDLDVPIYADAETTITFRGDDGIKFGLLVAGRQKQLGTTQADGFSIGIKDYSVKSTDDFGNTTLIQRDFAKLMEGFCMFDHQEAESIYTYMAAQRATSGLWIPEKSTGFAHTYVYGFWATFKIKGSEAPTAGRMNFSIEGLI